MGVLMRCSSSGGGGGGGGAAVAAAPAVNVGVSFTSGIDHLA